MKNVYLILSVFLFFSLHSFAQSEDQDPRFLFNKFEKGKVVFKKGGASLSMLNYNLLLSKFVFLSEDKAIMELGNPSLVSYIDINGRIFEQVKDSEFYEKMKADSANLHLYVKWSSSLMSQNKKSGYGVNPNASSNSSSDVDYDGHSFKSKVNKDIVLNAKNSFFIKLDGKFQKFNSADSLAKLFKSNETEIKKYLKDQKLNFKDIDDIKKAVEYCSQYKE